MPLRHVLLDADGVIQSLRGGWQESFLRLFGSRAEEFARAVGVAEQPSLRGEVPFRPILAGLLRRFDVAVEVDEAYGLWLDIVPEPTSIALVQELRSDGLGVHLATNQNPERRDHMRVALRYDEVFDTSFYSCEVGAAKPDAAYFEAILRRLDVPADQVLFVDDNHDNVAGAAEVGLRAEQWQLGVSRRSLREVVQAHRA